MKILLLSWLAMVWLPNYPTTFEGKVIHVIDGNTLEVLTDDKETIKIMLKEADCPELSQEYGDEALQFTQKLVLKKKVEVEVMGKDRWGNKLAVVKMKNGKLLHEELLKEGLAWAPDKSSALEQMEASAKAAKTGLWVREDPTPPWIYRRKQTMLQPKSLQ